MVVITRTSCSPMKKLVEVLLKKWYFSLLAKPFIVTLASPKEVYSYLGNSDPTWVRCKFDGFPEPFVTMRFKEKLMSNASSVAEKKLFTNALKDFGQYKCHAKNKFGSTNYTIELKLAGEKGSLFPVSSQFWRLKNGSNSSY